MKLLFWPPVKDWTTDRVNSMARNAMMELAASEGGVRG
jgi:hypothetical protein